MYALMGAYTEEGNQWLQQLRTVMTDNANFACDYIEKHFDGVTVSRPQGTYMLFIDCEQWCKKTGKSMDELICAGWDVGVTWQDGRMFGGSHTIRMNLALPKSRVEEAFQRLKTYVFV